MKRFCLALTVAAISLGVAHADTVIVNENFDSYPSYDSDPSQAAFIAAWRPDNGDGIVDPGDPTEAGFLVPNTGGFLNAPNDNPPGIQGQAVTVNSASHESTATFSLTPSATKWIRVAGDIFNDGPITNDSASGMRQAIGLRNDNFDRDPGTFGCQCGVNFLEMGFYNTAADDPRTPEPDLVPNTQFQYRIALFSQLDPPNNVAQPNWLSFQLDPALDTPTEPPPVGDFNDNGTVDAADYVAWKNAGPADTLPNDQTPGTVDASDYADWQTNFGLSSGNGIVDINDIGEGWHRFSALIKEDSITVELDLYRDGINNATGETGIPDASDTWPVQFNTAAGANGVLNSLRFGGPSGVSPNDQAAFDNIFLSEIDVPAGAGGLSVQAVPEPASLALAALSLAGLIAGGRRRRG